MMLIAISENIRRIDKVAGDQQLAGVAGVDWESIKGIRNILAHDYFSIDADEIYAICNKDLMQLKWAISQLRQMLFS
jgi:uncharacterized protein with HEPN domain